MTTMVSRGLAVVSALAVMESRQRLQHLSHRRDAAALGMDAMAMAMESDERDADYGTGGVRQSSSLSLRCKSELGAIAGLLDDHVDANTACDWMDQDLSVAPAIVDDADAPTMAIDGRRRRV